MVNYSDRPIVVDGVRLDTLAWGITKLNRQTAARRTADVDLPGVDGALPSVNDTLEPARMGLEMFVRGTDADGAVPAAGSRDTFRANLDELIHLFGKRHALLEVIEQTGPGALGVNLFLNPSFEAPGAGTVAADWASYLAGAGGTRTFTHVTTGVTSGAKAQRVQDSALGGAAGDRVGLAQSVPLEDAQGGTYTLSVDLSNVALATGKVMKLYVDCYGPTGQFVAAGGTLVFTTAGRKSLTVKAPVGTTVLSCYIWADGGGIPGAAAGPVDFTVDSALLTPGTETTYYDGNTPATPTEGYYWTGTPERSRSARRPLARRRAWAKVIDSIQPDVNLPGTAGEFTVGLEIPAGVWEDVVTSDWTSAAITSGIAQEVTTLQGGTERVSDSVVLVQGPATNPRVTDPTTGAYVELQRALSASELWRVNTATWSTRYGTGLTLASADTAGTDAQSLTRYGGAVNVASFLTLTPTRAGVRRTYATLSGTGITTATRLSIRARRKYA